MEFLRTPVVYVATALGLTTFTFYLYVRFWLDHPWFFQSLAEVLAWSAFLSAAFILVGIGSAIAAIRTRNAPLPWSVVVLLVLGLIAGLLFMFAASLARG